MAGAAIGLFFAARQAGRHAIGVAFVIPWALGESLADVLWWPDHFSAWGTFRQSALVMVLVPLAERALQRIAGAVRGRHGRH